VSKELALMSRSGKTFYFATLWLDQQTRLDSALAYAFCRRIDDIADASPQRGDRDKQLSDVVRALQSGAASHELVNPILPLIRRYPEIQEPLVALVNACRGDLPSLSIRDEQDFERYAHGVAGNVGLIMYPILGGTNPAGRSYAADLGIAMQSTNVARDVLEDLARGRVYLPISWLRGMDLRSVDITDQIVQGAVVDAVRQVLSFASYRYERGLSGLSFLSPRARSSIRIAARCYAAIGDRVIARERLSPKRAVVPLYRKIMLACRLSLSERLCTVKSAMVRDV